jgi:HlyD family secretion protein
MERAERRESRWLPGAHADPAEFAPALLRLQRLPPSPLGRGMLYAVLALIAATLAWAALGKLDVVAVADGKLVPASYLKIVQPAESGLVKEILVAEGERVIAGQVLARMDPVLAQADGKALATEYHAKRLALRRVDAQLAGRSLASEADDPPLLFAQVEAQRAANVGAFQSALAQERAALDKARHDLKAAEEVKAKILAVLPHYREQERAFGQLAKDGFAGKLLATDKTRERIEKEQDLQVQEAAIRAARAGIAQSEQRLEQIAADYRRQLRTERVETAAQAERLAQELAKQQHRAGLLELRAPADGVVKDLATHTPGTVVAPGTILMTLVPQNEALHAEVWVANADVGFVRPRHEVKLKLAAYQFQKYGMLEGEVVQVSADATEAPNPNTRSGALAGRDRAAGPLAFRALVRLKSQQLQAGGRDYALAAGMQVIAEIHLGERSVLEYLLSPVTRVTHEAGRER